MSTMSTLPIIHGTYADPPGYYYGEAMGGPLCSDCHRAAGYDVNEPDAHAIFPDNEADAPTHCQKCEGLIAHALTTDGEDYVRENLTDPAPWSRPEVLAAWREAYGYVLADEGGKA